MTLAHQFAQALPPDKRRKLEQMRREFDDPDSALLVRYVMEHDEIPQEYETRCWDFVQWVAERGKHGK